MKNYKNFKIKSCKMIFYLSIHILNNNFINIKQRLFLKFKLYLNRIK